MNRMISTFTFRALSVLAVATFLLPVTTFVQAQETMTAQPVARETRCPVCGMYPSRYPKWMVQLAFTDRTTLAFDSPLDLFRFLNNMAKYDRKHSRSDVAAVFLSDYAKGGWIEEKRAFFVIGSKARGPMNNADLPAFGSKEIAEQFAKSSGGKVFLFDQITPEILQEITQSDRAAHQDHQKHQDHSVHHH